VINTVKNFFAYSLPTERVSLAFPMVEGEFERNVQIWLQDRKISAKKSTVAKVEEKFCSFCIFAQVKYFTI
jgi:hypothetical protein